ncbi:MAG: pantetheine-phosphate adenylyltransferase [Acutalibacteraceae bacterium]|nr:pantetheine-phosphate adenylyltransferase [Acutalibacteraceae bacterium]
MKTETAIYPGSFDPITLGHLDIIHRAAKIFDKLIVVVMVNPAKKCAFSPEERVELIKKCTSDLDNITVEFSDGLLADYAKEKKAGAIIKGLRALSDFEYEFQMALTNSRLNPEVETLFLTTKAENMYLSSSMVRQIASMGGDISGFVPDIIHKQIINRLKG